jgi:hypothetical protein
VFPPTAASRCSDKGIPVVDRGGWSPDLFADIIDAGFDLLTWRKNDGRGKVPDLTDDAFAAMTCAGDDGRDREYDLADTAQYSRSYGQGSGSRAVAH